VLYPEFRTKDRMERVSNISSVFYVSPFNDRAIEIVNAFLEFLLKKVLLTYKNDLPVIKYDELMRKDEFNHQRQEGALLHLNESIFYQRSNVVHIWELRKKIKSSSGRCENFKPIDRSILSESYGQCSNHYRVNYDFYKNCIKGKKFNKTKSTPISRNTYNKIFFNSTYGDTSTDKLGSNLCDGLKVI